LNISLLPVVAVVAHLVVAVEPEDSVLVRVLVLPLEPITRLLLVLAVVAELNPEGHATVL
jgi:hypothetical protein